MGNVGPARECRRPNDDFARTGAGMNADIEVLIAWVNQAFRLGLGQQAFSRSLPGPRRVHRMCVFTGRRSVQHGYSRAARHAVAGSG
jgi:hypothetical protein